MTAIQEFVEIGDARLSASNFVRNVRYEDYSRLRTIVGGLIGFTVGLLIIMGWGISDGLTTGLPTANLPPSNEAALKSALVYTMYLWPFALVLGGGAGMVCGFGTWLTKTLVQRSKRHRDTPAI